LVALLVTVTLPARLPALAGAKATLKEVDCPAASEMGNAMEPVLNPVPLATICEMETLEFPVLVTVTFCVALVPAVRLPKLSEAGLAEICNAGAIPVPLTEMLEGELGALLTSVKMLG
jgi:hypothetical protein